MTDYEVSRPPSALTSYSNFHPGARRNLVPTAGPQVGPGGLEHGSFQLQPKTLTQDSFMTQQQPPQMPQQSEDDDDLPPPPPPLSSSPTPGNARKSLGIILLQKLRWNNARANAFWPTTAVGEADIVSSVSASACHSSGPKALVMAKRCYSTVYV